MGQVKHAVFETSGEISVFFYPDTYVSWGLSILPDAFKTWEGDIDRTAVVACIHCAQTNSLPQGLKESETCQKLSWVKASNEKRV